MLYVYAPGKKDSFASWHVGEHFDKLQEIAELNSNIAVQADGDELMHIGRSFPSFVCKRNVQRWYGDIARMILGNL